MVFAMHAMGPEHRLSSHLNRTQTRSANPIGSHRGTEARKYNALAIRLCATVPLGEHFSGAVGWAVSSVLLLLLLASSAAAQRREASGAGVYKARIAPHWFDGDSKFWYQNDL